MADNTNESTEYTHTVETDTVSIHDASYEIAHDVFENICLGTNINNKVTI